MGKIIGEKGYRWNSPFSKKFWTGDDQGHDLGDLFGGATKMIGEGLLSGKNDEGGIGGKLGQAWDSVSGKDAADVSLANAQMQYKTGENQLDFQKEMYDDIRADMQPTLDRQKRFGNYLEYDMGQGNFTPEDYNFQYDDFKDPGAFQAEEFDFEADPGYQFRQDEAQKALLRKQSALGGLGGGATTKDLMMLSQKLASQEYKNSFNRFVNERKFDSGQWDKNRAFERKNYNSDRNFAENTYGKEWGSGVDNMNNKFNQWATMAGIQQVNAAPQMGQFNQQNAENMNDIMQRQTDAMTKGSTDASNAKSQGAENVAGGLGWLFDKFMD